MNRTLKITVSALSDPGMVRANNEDSFLLCDLVRAKSLPDTYILERELTSCRLLMVVSDGVGGSHLGELASELTVLTIKDALLNIDPSIDVVHRVTAAVEQANHIIFTENKRSPRLAGMKATSTLVLVEADQAYIANVGDSRCYLIHNGEISQVTIDQTLGEILLSQGVLTAEQVARHSKRNVIVQAIGNSNTLQVPITRLRLSIGDRLLLCSDGLSNKLSPDELCTHAVHYSTETACKMMVELARNRGGEDNITVILASFEGNALPPPAWLPELEELVVFDPNRDQTSNLKRTELLGGYKSKREVGSVFPLVVRGVDSLAGNFCERSETLQVSERDMSFMLRREVAVDDLLYITLPMPTDLRLYDHEEPEYRIYAQVRKVSRQESGYYLIRVAFISRDNPGA